MVQFGTVSEVVVNYANDSSEADIGLNFDEFRTAGGKGRSSLHGNISDDGLDFALGSSTESSPKSSESRSWLCDETGRPTAMIVVKNTFIDCYTHEDLDTDQPPVVATKSCPVLLGRLAPPEETLPRKPSRARTVQLLQAESVEMDRLVAASQSPCELPAVLVLPVKEDLRRGQERQDAPQDVVTLDAREPSMSVGSVLHEHGECRPCAWYWRPQGCDNGQACRHCHLCPQGTLKARRKAKMVAARQQERADLGEEQTFMSCKAWPVQLALGRLL